MNTKFFPVIDLAATGNNIRRLRIERGLTVRDIQSYFGFEEPRAVLVVLGIVVFVFSLIK